MIRVIASLLWNGQTLVKGVGFDAWRSVGHPLQAINVFQMREVDEILFLDITATKEGRRPNFALVEQLAEKCFVPLTVGGGVKSVEDVRDLLRAGADKALVHSCPYIAWEAAGHFGAQAIVGCVEVDADGFTEQGIDSAGELMVQSRPRDGTMCGYDLVTVRVMTQDGTQPVIASGGAGTYEHFAQVLDAGASAVAAGAMWLFTEQTPLEAKRYLKARGYDVRL